MAYTPPKPPTYRTVNWAAVVRRAWGKEWNKPEVGYKFSNGRTFDSSDAGGGPYRRGS